MNIDTRLNRYTELVNNELENALSSVCGIQEQLRRAMLYSIESGGKRIRPCLTLMVCEMLHGDLNRALPIACGIEMIHTYSLIHDDLPCMDDDDMRRGRPSNHKVFGEAMALLAGDGLLSFAFEYMLSYAIRFNDPGFYRALYEVARRAGAAGMISGQAADMTSDASLDEDTLRYIDLHKTADMLAASVLGGANVAGCDAATMDKLERYAVSLGMLFQITDDILDFTSSSSDMGKTVGKDSANNKLTHVTCYGVEGAISAADNAVKECVDALDGIDGNRVLVLFAEKIRNRRS